jgi:hypothetical protein
VTNWQSMLVVVTVLASPFGMVAGRLTRHLRSGCCPKPNSGSGVVMSAVAGESDAELHLRRQPSVTHCGCETDLRIGPYRHVEIMIRATRWGR